MTTNVNLNPHTNLTIDEVEEKKEQYTLEKHELSMKKALGMPMSHEEEDRLEYIDTLITQCDFIIDWLTITGDEEYDWTID